MTILRKTLVDRPGDRQRLQDALRRLAPGGGYVCSSSHDITDNIPFENFCALPDGSLQTSS